jgi:hypothetical protein
VKEPARVIFKSMSWPRWLFAAVEQHDAVAAVAPIFQ